VVGNSEVGTRTGHVVLLAEEACRLIVWSFLETAGKRDTGKRAKAGPDGVTPVPSVRGYSVWSRFPPRALASPAMCRFIPALSEHELPREPMTE